MSNYRYEKVSEHLLNIDEKLLVNAHEIDNAEKLNKGAKYEVQ